MRGRLFSQSAGRTSTEGVHLLCDKWANRHKNGREFLRKRAGSSKTLGLVELKCFDAALAAF